MEGAAALTTTRLFSSLQLQPYDTRYVSSGARDTPGTDERNHRLAASVEMFEVARPILRSSSYERSRRIPRADLDRYNTGMKVPLSHHPSHENPLTQFAGVGRVLGARPPTPARG